MMEDNSKLKWSNTSSGLKTLIFISAVTPDRGPAWQLSDSKAGQPTTETAKKGEEGGEAREILVAPQGGWKTQNNISLTKKIAIS